MTMKTTLPLFLALATTASPALAIDWPIFLGRYEPEYAGYVDHWPQVVRVRALERLCLPQQIAIVERDKAALEARTPSIYGPAFGHDATATPAPPPPPAAAEPTSSGGPTMSTPRAEPERPTTGTPAPSPR